MDGFLAFSNWVNEWINSVIGWIASAMLLVLTLFTLLEIIRRYIFSVVFEWGQDATVVGMVATVALYFGVSQIRRNHLVMNAVLQLLHARGHFKTVGFSKIIISAIIVLFCCAVGITGWSTLSYAWDRNLTTYSLLIPLWPFYFILMFGFLLMAFVAFLQTIEDIISYTRGDHLEDEIELTTDV
jgi:TRAP-type C4-dicarboxylate transport system permease small subunit